MQKCFICSSDKIQLWLGGSIGILYQCTHCNYIGPVILETASAVPEDLVAGSKSLFRAGNFWSETGIGNQSLFET